MKFWCCIHRHVKNTLLRDVKQEEDKVILCLMLSQCFGNMDHAAPLADFVAKHEDAVSAALAVRELAISYQHAQSGVRTVSHEDKVAEAVLRSIGLELILEPRVTPMAVIAGLENILNFFKNESAVEFFFSDYHHTIMIVALDRNRWFHPDEKLPSPREVVETNCGPAYVNMHGIWFRHLANIGVGTRLAAGEVFRWRRLEGEIVF